MFKTAIVTCFFISVIFALPAQKTVSVHDATLKGEKLKEAIAPEVDGFIDAIKRKLNDLIIGLKVQLYRIVDGEEENDSDEHENIVSIDFLFSPKDVLTDYHDELVKKHEDTNMKPRGIENKNTVDQDSHMYDILNIFKDAFRTQNDAPLDTKKPVENNSKPKVEKLELAKSTANSGRLNQQSTSNEDYVKLFDLQHIARHSDSDGSVKNYDDDMRSLHDFLYSISSFWNEMDSIK